MVKRAQVAKVGAATGLFLAIVLGLVALRWRLGIRSGPLVEPQFVVVALVPFLFYLTITRRLKRFSGGGFEFVLRKQAEKPVVSAADSAAVVESQVVADDAGEGAADVAPTDLDTAGKPTTLAFEIGRDGGYSVAAVRESLRAAATAPDLRHVVFTDGSGRFEGYADADAVNALVANEATAAAVVDELGSGAILDRALVRTASVPQEATTRETLERMDREGLDEVAVVDDRGGFVCVLTRDRIVQRVLSGTLLDV